MPGCYAWRLRPRAVSAPGQDGTPGRHDGCPLRRGKNPIQLPIIAGATVPVISEHYTHLTKDDAYEAMLRALTTR